MRIFVLLAGLFLSSPGTAIENDSFLANLDSLAPSEQYRQLSLMMLVADGVDDNLLEGMEMHVGDSQQDGQTAINLEDYTTPLIRIVDQETMLAGSAQLFRFTRENAAEIAARLKTIEQQFPKLDFAAQGAAISEDAIIIRNAIADSIDFSEGRPTNSTKPLSRTYRERTIYLRNNLEYELFTFELGRITDQAIASVGGTTEAYERMFDDEIDHENLNKKIDAAEFIYDWDRDFDKRAARLAEEILNTIWDEESGQINP